LSIRGTAIAIANKNDYYCDAFVLVGGYVIRFFALLSIFEIFIVTKLVIQGQQKTNKQKLEIRDRVQLEAARRPMLDYANDLGV